MPLLLQLAFFSIAAGAVLAVLLALMRLSGNPVLDYSRARYVFVFRGTPLLVQIFLIYYGLGQFPRSARASSGRSCASRTGARCSP